MSRPVRVSLGVSTPFTLFVASFHFLFAIHQTIIAMSIEIVTKEDLQVLRLQLISDIRQLLDGLPKPVDQTTWLKTSDVKKLLKLSTSTLQTYRLNGTVKYTKIGGTLYYDVQHLQKILKVKT